MAKEKKVEAVKELVISLPELAKPNFNFKGTWCGKDVRLILRHITQEYRRHQIAQAKAMAPVQEQPVLTGVSNDRTE